MGPASLPGVESLLYLLVCTVLICSIFLNKVLILALTANFCPGLTEQVNPAMLTVVGKKKNQQILTLERQDVWHFCLINNLENELATILIIDS